MSLVHKKAKEIEAFYIDMEEVFLESYRILKRAEGAVLLQVIQNIKGQIIANAEVFAESLQYAGFILDRIIKREIPSKILPQRDEKQEDSPAMQKQTVKLILQNILLQD